VELGLNGASGNTNNSNLFFGWDGKREYREGDLSFDVDYFFQKADSDVTMDRAVALGRYEREIGESAVNWFVQGFLEYDNLRAYPARLSVTAGLSKQLVETDRFKLTGRIGAGASKKIDAPDDQWRPELQIGGDYEYKLTERQRLFGFVDYYPDMSDFSTYRLNWKVAWEALLEDDWGLAMRASLMNWYDSDPGPGTEANDLYYVLALTWGY
jgi:putative salt-induced outer membrane protein YdiY